MSLGMEVTQHVLSADGAAVIELMEKGNQVRAGKIKLPDQCANELVSSQSCN